MISDPPPAIALIAPAATPATTSSKISVTSMVQPTLRATPDPGAVISPASHARTTGEARTSPVGRAEVGRRMAARRTSRLGGRVGTLTGAAEERPDSAEQGGC
ncbi:hypothetical protein Aph02nite_21280 [Actinoplanes philippinensis]|nr:hypothetical protein Aph02nite_21280 [Actinoplanes philippinensis]